MHERNPIPNLKRSFLVVKLMDWPYFFHDVFHSKRILFRILFTEVRMMSYQAN